MTDYLRREKNQIADGLMQLGADTGPLSRILSGIFVLLCIIAIVFLFVKKSYIPAVILLLVGFTRFGHFVVIGIAIYCIVIGNWVCFLILGVGMLAGHFAHTFGRRHIRRSYSEAPKES